MIVNGGLERAEENAIRRLRKDRRMTAERLAHEAGISPTTLSRLENDRIGAPERSTLERLIVALDSVKPLAVGDRRDILQPFGFADGAGLPGKADIQKAVKAWAPPFRNGVFPAYLVDYSQRVLDWNDAALLLIGGTREQMAGKNLTVFDLAFNRVSQGNVQLLDRPRFLREMVVVMKSEFRPFLAEEWCQQCVGDARRRYPEFDALWEAVHNDELVDVAVRSMGPVRLAFGADCTLTFRIIGTDLVSDPRFRAVQYMPEDPATAALCFARLG